MGLHRWPFGSCLELIEDQQTWQKSSYELLREILLSSRKWFALCKNSVLTHLAMAIKCRTALVDPPRAITVTIALRSDLGVMMSRGFKSILIKSRRYFPARRHSSNFRGSSAGVEELFYHNRKREKRKWHQFPNEVVSNKGEEKNQRTALIISFTCKEETFPMFQWLRPLYLQYTFHHMPRLQGMNYEPHPSFVHHL